MQFEEQQSLWIEEEKGSERGVGGGILIVLIYESF
jgi:hypothetical protein